ncbi:MAG TPA: 3-deoxy-manno-octulosonate cytidylyltransferase [Candidatus Gastranaerophilales bacterium]|nr:3-deoxy-manno-octulosonate cytidylyltransferase [Candidatus Gastranaerophilales bacterium]
MIAIIIPARYASIRLPGKPLIEIKGKPIIQWVYEQAKKSKLADSVIVATDDKRIFDAVKGFGGCVEMTSSEHKSGSDRIAEIAGNNPEIDIAVNVQGDEPLITPESIDKAIQCLISDKNADISTLIREITDKQEILNPNLVKAVIAKDGKALYFSRAAIPFEREMGHAKFFAHIGLYVYRRDALFKMTTLAQTDLEQAESLEQLRALQNGMIIKTETVDYKPLGIDTPEDIEEFKKIVING